jgi:serine/threonine protein kinase
MATGSITANASTLGAADTFGLAGRTVDSRYRIDGVIGDGGFSVVYRAHDLRTERDVAIKVLKIEVAAEDGDAIRDEVRRETEVLFTLAEYPISVVRPLDRGAVLLRRRVWAPYIVTELLRGATLEEILQFERESGELRPVSLADAVTLLDAAAEALATAHEIGIAHCDIKPSNLFVVDVPGKPLVKVLDFGVAKEFSSDGKTMTRLGDGFTKEYAAPEQFDGKAFGKTGPHTDVFAFALVVIELLTGALALDGDQILQLAYSATRPDRRPTPRGKGLKNVSDTVEAVFAMALAVDPSERYASMRAFWTNLKQQVPVAQRVSWPSAPVTRYRPGLTTGSTSNGPVIVDPWSGGSGRPPQEPRAPTRPRSTGMRWALAAFASLLAIAAIGFVARGRSLSAIARPSPSEIGSSAPSATASASPWPTGTVTAASAERPSADTPPPSGAESSVASTREPGPQPPVITAPSSRAVAPGPSPTGRTFALPPSPDCPLPPAPANGRAYTDADCPSLPRAWGHPDCMRLSRCADFHSPADCAQANKCFYRGGAALGNEHN